MKSLGTIYRKFIKAQKYLLMFKIFLTIKQEIPSLQIPPEMLKVSFKYLKNMWKRICCSMLLTENVWQ